MIRKVFVLLLVFSLAAVCWAGAELFTFRVFPVVDHSQIEWKTGTETNVQMFVVERSANATDFFAVGQVAARGSYSEYRFTDSSPLDVDMSRTFYYRLKMVDRDGSYRYSEVRDVSLTFSAVQHTWGSIKAMFR